MARRLKTYRTSVGFFDLTVTCGNDYLGLKEQNIPSDCRTA
jgi:hypothetical protein